MKTEAAEIRDTSNGPTSTRADSQWPKILAAVENRSVRPADLVRLILREMSLVCRDLHEISGHSSLEFKLKPLVAEVHALRTLAETLRYETELAVQTDIVNLDGPKFNYVFREVAKAFKDSMRDAGYDIEASSRILRAFADNISVRESDLRRNMEKVTAFPEDAAPLWPKSPSTESATNLDADGASKHPAT